MFGLFDPLLGPGNSNNLAVVGYSGHANLGGSHLLQILQFLPQLAQNPAVVFFWDRDLLTSLQNVNNLYVYTYISNMR